MTRFTLLLSLIFCLLPRPSLGEKTDIVILNNGDRVTGEVIRLEAGLLEFNTDTMGRIFVEWRFISEVISDKSQSIEMVDGSRWLGQLQKPEEGDHVIINTIRGPVDVAPQDVVSVWPVKATFWDKVDLETAVGFDYAKATDITNFTLSVDFSHRSEERLTESSLRSDITTQSEGEEQHRNEFRFNHNYLRPEQKFRTWLAGFDANDALGVDLRVYGGASIGKYFVKTNSRWFTLSGGLLATQESPEGGSSETNLEAIGYMRYRYFRFADPERNFDTTFSIFPSLTDIGRVRLDLRSTFRLEFFSDLFWSMELYYTHDSDPLTANAEKTDYGIMSSLGWSY